MKSCQHISAVHQVEVTVVRSTTERKHLRQTWMVQASLRSTGFLERGNQVQDPEPMFFSSTLLRAGPLPLGSREGLLLEEEETLRTDARPSATGQETAVRLAQQLLLRDHSPPGPPAMFALTV